MKTFDIYEHPGNSYQLLVEQGFNWPSCFFGPFWYLAKGMGLWALLWFASAIVVGYVTFGILLIPVWIASGLLANDIYRKHLLSQGYRHKGTYQGFRENFDTALSGTVRIRPEEATKKCPQCAETIKFEAVVCRYCQHRFDADEVRSQVAGLQRDQAPPAEPTRSTERSPISDRPWKCAACGYAAAGGIHCPACGQRRS